MVLWLFSTAVPAVILTGLLAILCYESAGKEASVEGLYLSAAGLDPLWACRFMLGFVDAVLNFGSVGWSSSTWRLSASPWFSFLRMAPSRLAFGRSQRSSFYLAAGTFSSSASAFGIATSCTLLGRLLEF